MFNNAFFFHKFEQMPKIFGKKEKLSRLIFWCGNTTWNVIKTNQLKSSPSVKITDLKKKALL